MKIVNDLGLLAPTATSTYKTRFVIAICPECDEEFTAQLRSINSGHTKSCGCLKKTNKKIVTTKYLKESHPRVYSIWKNMRNRCRNTKIKQAVNYSLKGITVCDEWNSFEKFLEWSLANGYKSDLTIDRIIVNEGYSPSNCRWATIKEQCENTELLRSTNTSGYRGVSLRNDKFMARATNNITKERVYLGKFNTAEEAGLAYDAYVISNNLKYPLNFSNTNGNSIKKG